jgi:SAM-dependent methyltransferase
MSFAPPLALNAWLRYDGIRRALCGVPAGATMLEIGAGQGGVGARLARRFNYLGVEPDPVSAPIARHRVEPYGGRIVQGTWSDLPPAAYRIVAAFEVLEHIEDDRTALLQWSHFLEPGGMLVLTVPAYQSRFAAADRSVGHHRRYDPHELRSQIEAIGLTRVEIWMTGFPLGYALEHIRNLLAWLHPRRGTMHDKSLASGRLYQPLPALALATQAVTLPFRLMQRPFAHTRLGTGLVVRAVRP